LVTFEEVSSAIVRHWGDSLRPSVIASPAPR
jgi:hypothetical protein